ncbi:hypothetical protein [Massilia sp. CCM 8734]|uniref:hypothetical protein n=1 Tax=Massilia sp. CCM 8734 TaxID=2609283 RepID=UPI001424227F|nr:hypothetical protein [Massilia sp. CCM 8734]NIA00660.1 hypothetical protein [Massilia sp. CCM 8734]
MNIVAFAACASMCLPILQAQARGLAPAPVGYRVADSTPTTSVAIQTVSVDAVAGMPRKAVVHVNAILKATAAGFADEAKQCGAAAQGRPWGYKLAFDKVLVSDAYLSVVFAKSTVCAGSPDEEKEARVFALKTGELVPARALFKQMLPSATIMPSITKNKELIRLDEQTAETLIDDSKLLLNIDDERCDFYLKKGSYRIWVEGKNLVFFPEFIQPYSFCQTEYLIKPE